LEEERGSFRSEDGERVELVDGVAEGLKGSIWTSITEE
jgi:hypothetical protein